MESNAFSEGNEAAGERFVDEPGGWEDVAEDGGGYEPQEEVGPPNVGEALAQMQAQQAQILERLDGEEEEYEDDDGSPEYGAQLPEMSDEELYELAEQSDWLGEDAEEMDAEDLDELIQERVEQAIIPLAADYEFDRRVEKLHGLAERYPELRDPAAIGEIEAEALRLGEAYGINAANLDPGLIELIVQARGARATANAELEAPDAEPGAVLETGVGPSPQTEEIDPQTKAYRDAIAGVKSNNAFTA